MRRRDCRHPKHSLPAAVAALLGVLLASSTATATIIYNLGTLGGGYSGGYAVNDAGQVTGYSPPAANTYQHAFRYDGTPGAGGIMRDLGTLGGMFSEGYGVNNAGQVTGYSKLTEDFLGFSENHAFRYDGTPGSGGVMLDLGTLGGGYSGGRAINDVGQVAGSSLIESSAQHAFRYDGTPGAGGVMRDLGTLGGTGSEGYGVNNAGQVAGSSDITGDATRHAFRYDGTPGAGGVMRDLGTLGGMGSDGLAINDAGQVTGSSSVTGNTASHAFLYTGSPGSGGVMRDLGTLGGSNSSGWAVNDSGQVAGNSQISGNTASHAFLYTGTPGAGGMMIDLDDWLDANNPTEGIKWTLLNARGVTNSGLITGIGLYDPDGPGGIAADSRAYLLDGSALIVPEPAAGALALLGVSSFLLLRRRCVWRPNKFLWARGDFHARRQFMRSRRFALVAFLMCTSAAARAFAAASLTPLGSLPGDLSSIANSVSGDGSVVVGVSGGYGGQAFRWTAAGGMVGLGRTPGDFYSYARGVSADGSVVVGGSDYAEVDTEIYRIQAARWTAAGGMQSLGHLPGGGFSGVALGVSGDGSVIVGTSDSASGDQAFRWTAAGGMQGLGDLPGGGFLSEANGVSADGSVIVGYGYSASDYEAFRWTSAGGMVGLGFLPGDFSSQANGVSADGAIVVGTSSSASSMHVFRWTIADGMVGLGSLPGGFNPMGFSADGSVVVGYETQGVGPSYAALYWTPDGGMRPLWDVLLSQGVDPAADGWSSLGFAKAISADGNTIVGDGIRNGHQEAFIAVVPEPTGLALLVVSGVLAVRRRCRH